MIEAGSETTSQVLNNCLVGLLSNANAVKKAHEELDRVIGTDRTPTFDDEGDLPYIRAIIKVTVPFHINFRKSSAGVRSINSDRTIMSLKTTGIRATSSPRTRSS
jgi:hypothetical protein